MASVTVQIEWPADLSALPENAQARVTVEDVTLADESSVVVAETVLDDLDLGRQPVVEVEVGDIDPNADLNVRVHVTEAGREKGDVQVGDLVTTESLPVLTRGRGNTVAARLRLV